MNLTEENISAKFNIASLKGADGYDVLQVLSAYSAWSRTRSEAAWGNVETAATASGFEDEDLQAIKSVSLRNIQQTVASHREGQVYGLVTTELAEIGENAYSNVSAQADELQRHQWDLKVQGFDLEYERWNDTMKLQSGRGNLQWEKMSETYLRMWRNWMNDAEDKIGEKERKFAGVELALQQDRDEWMKETVEGGLTKRQINIRQSVMDGLSGIENLDLSVDAQSLADNVISSMRPQELSGRLINAAHALDISFSLMNVKSSGWNNTTAETFKGRMKQYVAEIEQTAKLKLAESVQEQVVETTKSYSDALSEQDKAYQKGMDEMFLENKFKIAQGNYQREAITSSTVIYGDKTKMQNIGVYRNFGETKIDYVFAQQGQLTSLGDYEIDLYCRKAMDELEQLFKVKQDKLVEHFGDAPTFNDKGEVSVSGKGEQGRLIADMVAANTEKAKGDAMADQPFYKKNLTDKVTISVSMIVKTGLMFVPGGQAASLAMTMMENMVELGSGRMNLAQLGVSLLTSAVSAGASWLGNAAGALIEKGVGTATKLLNFTGQALSSVTKTAFNTAGNAINQGFKVNKKGGIDFRYEKNEDVWGNVNQGFYSGLASGLVSSGINGGLTIQQQGKSSLFLGQKAFNENVASASSLIGGLAGELVNMSYTKEFNMNVLNLGMIMSKWNLSGKEQNNNKSFLETWSDTIYQSDSDISRIQNLGLGMTISEKGFGYTSQTKGWDVSELTMKAGKMAWDRGVTTIDHIMNKEYYAWVDQQVAEYEFREGARKESKTVNLLAPDNERLKLEMDKTVFALTDIEKQKENDQELDRLAKENGMTKQQLLALNPQINLKTYTIGETLNTDKNSLIPTTDKDYIFNGVNYSELMQNKDFVFYQEDGKTPKVSKKEVKKFLESKNTFLNKYKIGFKSVADVIYEKGEKYNINPMLLLSQMQGEQCILSMKKQPSKDILEWILNVGAQDNINPTTGKRAVKYQDKYKGVENQIDGAFKTFRKHYDDFQGKSKIVDIKYTDVFNDEKNYLGLGKIKVNNAATYSLFMYTPWISDPNQYIKDRKLGGSQMTLNLVRKKYLNLK